MTSVCSLGYFSNRNYSNLILFLSYLNTYLKISIIFLFSRFSIIENDTMYLALQAIKNNDDPGSPSQIQYLFNILTVICIHLSSCLMAHTCAQREKKGRAGGFLIPPEK